MRSKFGKKAVATGLIAAFGVNVATATIAFADPGRGGDKGRHYGRDDNRRDNRGDDRNRDYRGQSRHSQPARDDHDGNRGRRNTANDRYRPAESRSHGAPVRVVRKPVVVQRTVVHREPAARYPHGRYGPAPTRVIVVPERRVYRNVHIVRDYGHRYYGYGHYRRDEDAYKWLAFTAITVAIINNLSVQQQRAYEDAQIRATTAPVGQTIYWNDAGAHGTVTATREGTSSLNRYCREFQKTVTIGGRTEQAYGTACMQPDGAWEVVSNNGY